jgi:hypothetical protein
MLEDEVDRHRVDVLSLSRDLWATDAVGTRVVLDQVIDGKNVVSVSKRHQAARSVDASDKEIASSSDTTR